MDITSYPEFSNKRTDENSITFVTFYKVGYEYIYIYKEISNGDTVEKYSTVAQSKNEAIQKICNGEYLLDYMTQ